MKSCETPVEMEDILQQNMFDYQWEYIPPVFMKRFNAFHEGFIAPAIFIHLTSH